MLLLIEKFPIMACVIHLLSSGLHRVIRGMYRFGQNIMNFIQFTHELTGFRVVFLPNSVLYNLNSIGRRCSGVCSQCGDLADPLTMCLAGQSSEIRSVGGPLLCCKGNSPRTSLFINGTCNLATKVCLVVKSITHCLPPHYYHRVPMTFSERIGGSSKQLCHHVLLPKLMKKPCFGT